MAQFPSDRQEIRPIIREMVRLLVEGDLDVEVMNNHQVRVHLDRQVVFLSMLDYERFHRMLTEEPYASRIERLPDVRRQSDRIDQITSNAVDEFWPRRGRSPIELDLELSASASTTAEATRWRTTTASPTIESNIMIDPIVTVSVEVSASLSVDATASAVAEVT